MAVGVIVNSDPLPGAWLSRYDRMVSQQVVDAVRGRFAAGANPPGLSLTVAGEERPGGAPLVENEGVLSKLLRLEKVSGAPLMEGSAFSFSPQTPTAAGMAEGAAPVGSPCGGRGRCPPSAARRTVCLWLAA